MCRRHFLQTWHRKSMTILKTIHVHVHTHITVDLALLLSKQIFLSLSSESILNKFCHGSSTVQLFANSGLTNWTHGSFLFSTNGSRIVQKG